MAKLLIKYPTRGRAAQFLIALEEYTRKLSQNHDVHILITADKDDIAMHPRNKPVQVAIEALGDKASIHYGGNKQKTKIGAINADMDKAPFVWDILILASDDMLPIVQGYDEIVVQQMKRHFPDLDGCLFFNDGTDATKAGLNTLSIMGRTYYERIGYIYNPAYKAFFCDNEHTEVAKAMGKLAYVDEVIIRHEHPVWGGHFKPDAIYSRANRYWKEDERTFKRRQAVGFGMGVTV